MRKRGGLLTGAETAGITVPDELPDPETTTVWQSLAAEMGFARDVCSGSYTTVGFHVRGNAKQWQFHTRLEPGPFTDLIASACVIAQLRLLQRAAEFFGWTIDIEKVDDLLARAQEINTVAATRVGEEPSEQRLMSAPD